MRLISTGLASTHWASLGMQHNQLTEEMLMGRHVHRVCDEQMEEDVICLPLKKGSIPSAALLTRSSNTSNTLQTAISTLKSTDDESIEAAATLAALFKPDILNLL